MASEVEIVNVALTLLGEGRIVSVDQDTKAAREAKALLSTSRRALLAGYNWSFAMTRTQLSPLADVPSFGFGAQYQFPAGALRIVQIGQFFVGIDLTDYRGADTSEWHIEGRKILTDLGSPLPIRYVQDVTDTTQWTPNFVKAYACYLATDLAEPLTQSGTKRQAAESAFQREISLAIRANAIELPPQKLADDEWLMSRL